MIVITTQTLVLDEYDLDLLHLTVAKKTFFNLQQPLTCSIEMVIHIDHMNRRIVGLHLLNSARTEPSTKTYGTPVKLGKVALVSAQVP